MVESATPMFLQSKDGGLVRVIDGSNQHPVYERYDAQEGLFVEDFEFVYAITQGRDPEDDFEYQEHELLSEGEFPNSDPAICFPSLSPTKTLVGSSVLSCHAWAISATARIFFTPPAKAKHAVEKARKTSIITTLPRAFRAPSTKSYLWIIN